MRTPALLALSLSIAFVAGCTTEPEPTPSPSIDPMTDPVTDTAGLLAFSGCRQFHTYFPARAEDFQSQVPEGFSLVADEAGLLTLRVEATACTTGPVESARMLWITLPVVPPAGLADADASHSLAIEAYVDSEATLAWLHASGAHLAEACVCTVTDAPAPALADSFRMDGAEDDYLLQTTLTQADGPFDAFRSWTYVAADGQAVVRILSDNQESVSRGFGTALLAYLGPGGAPPATPGEIAHVVDDLAFTWMAEPLEVA